MIQRLSESIAQRRTLNVIAGRAAALGPVTWHNQPGDVVSLVLGVPSLRGVEIVAATTDRVDGRVYDVWGQNGSDLLETGLTADEVVAWLAKKASC